MKKKNIVQLIFSFFCLILKNFSTYLYLCVKNISQSLNENNPENYILTMEKKITEDSIFLMKNKELEPFYEKTVMVFSDAFFNMVHFKTRTIIIFFKNNFNVFK